MTKRRKDGGMSNEVCMEEKIDFFPVHTVLAVTISFSQKEISAWMEETVGFWTVKYDPDIKQKLIQRRFRQHEKLVINIDNLVMSGVAVTWIKKSYEIKEDSK